MDPLPLYRQLINARKAARLTQAALAREMDCAQSAISMMENGRIDALSKATIEKIAKRLGVEIPRDGDPKLAAVGDGASLGFMPSIVRICPNPYCPSNYPYLVCAEAMFLSRPHKEPGDFCELCGEVLVDRCEGCGEPLSPFSACCSKCGKPHVMPPAPAPANPEQWVAERQALAQVLAGMKQF